MKLLKIICLVCFAVITLSACSIYRIDSSDTSLDFYEPKKSAIDVVYKEQIDRPYQEIGKVYVTTERSQSFEELIYMMKREAAILGGDAITELESDASGIWKRFVKADFLKNGYVIAKFSAKVVVFK